MRSHSSETSGNAANVNSQKSHCFCLAWLWHSEGLQKHLYAITHGVMVLAHQSKRRLCWCKLHSLYQYQKLEYQIHACVINKIFVNENWGDFQGHLLCCTVQPESEYIDAGIYLHHQVFTLGELPWWCQGHLFAGDGEPLKGLSAVRL